MQTAVVVRPDGTTLQVRADGSEVGSGDLDRKVLHLLPKLMLDSYTLSGLDLASVSLEVISPLGSVLAPEGGVRVRQPYPNQSYLVGGSATMRHGWCVPADDLPDQFGVEFRWTFKGCNPFIKGMDWVVRHLLHINRLPGQHRTHTMAVYNWPNRAGEAAPLYRAATAFARQSQFTDAYRNNRQIRSITASWNDAGEQVGFVIDEGFSMPAIPYEQATAIGDFAELQLHELPQTTHYTAFEQEHRANGVVELPADLLLRAINLAIDVPYSQEQDVQAFALGTSPMGRLEQHPALRLLCEWWEQNRKDKPGAMSAGLVMPHVRVLDDEEYWCAYLECPPSPITSMAACAESAATCGDGVLVQFLASVKHSTFSNGCLDVHLADGRSWTEVGVSRGDVESGEYDEAWYSLEALSGFPDHFPAAYENLVTLAGRQARPVTNSVDVESPQ